MDKAVGRSRVHIYLKNTKTTKKTSELSVMDKVVGRSCVKMSMSKNKKKTKKGIWGDQDNLISNNLNAKPGNNE